jgi:hypothetical protein
VRQRDKFGSTETLSCARFSRQGQKEGVRQVVDERCCGLDVHAKTVVACLLTPGKKEIRTFSTMTTDLLHLLEWLTGQGCIGMKGRCGFYGLPYPVSLANTKKMNLRSNWHARILCH